MTEPRRVAITGASGFLGSALAAALRAGGTSVIRIGRGRDADVHWDVERGVLPPTPLEGVAAVVHLAGAPIARRWTAARKRAIRDSRVDGTRLLSRTLATLTSPPAVLLSGSAVGIYGSCGDAELDERAAHGDDFLARTVADWERATHAADAAGVRVVHLRTGLVLAREGGVLAKLLLPFQLGLGGRVGAGTQWMSCVSRHDWIRAVQFLLGRDVRGPVNIVGPEPVRNAEFARALGTALHRPSVLPLPARAVRVALGEMGDATLLASQRAVPARLRAAGFAFDDETVGASLARALGGRPAQM